MSDFNKTLLIVSIETSVICISMAFVFIFAPGAWKWMGLFLLFALTSLKAKK